MVPGVETRGYWQVSLQDKRLVLAALRTLGCASDQLGVIRVTSAGIWGKDLGNRYLKARR